jgi:hypothetical protein
MNRGFNSVLPRALGTVLLLSSGWCVTALADAPPEPVHWNVALVSKDPIRKGSDATLEVSGVIEMAGTSMPSSSCHMGQPHCALRSTKMSSQHS